MNDATERRILLLALRGRDSEIMDRLLNRGGHECVICMSGDKLADALSEGAGAVVVTEESLAETDRSKLVAWLCAQPPWSDFPFILLATKRAGRRPKEAAHILNQLGNVVVLERPVHGETLGSAVDAALRARRRQYEARSYLNELQSAEETLRQLNGTLELRICERTQDLARANDQLMQEIAEREKAQVALVQSQKMDAMGQLTGGIAHDFNNLLTVISGNLELISRRVDDERISRLAKYAGQAADRAGKLTRQLLAFSRTQRLAPEPVDVNGLIRGMDDLLARTIGPMYQIVMDLDPSDPWAMADSNQMELAILNLAINARDAMAKGGPLQIFSEASDADSLVLIKVKDSGAGIPTHIMNKVFDPFFTTKPIGKGTGLGLSQVYGLLEQSGGSVSLESTEGVGTTVILRFPAAKPALYEAAPDLSVSTSSARGDERVLVIEDDDGVRRFIVDCLQSLGYVVTEASDGVEGLDRLRAETPELLIVDYAMPGLTGVDVIKQSRSAAPNLPIILATGYADMDAVHRVVDASQVLRKPFQIGDLETAVRRALTSAPRHN
jgi:signal transduction histidine kinase/ActR/RegA family two-component response regulator